MKYSKLCCKCKKGYKFTEDKMGTHDLVLCDDCYINILVGNYIKLICSSS